VFEYWIFHPSVLEFIPIPSFYEHLISSVEINCFQGKNIFVIQSFVPFEDGNVLLDDLLVLLAKHFVVHDKGIIKSHWQTQRLL
jgi:hypothetical protein